MTKLTIYIRDSNSVGLLHDSRKDIVTISKVVNQLIDKVNELIDENERLKSLLRNEKQ